MNFLSPSKTKNYTNPSLVIEILVMLAFNIAVYFIFSKIDLLEILYRFSRQHENYELDEIIPLLFSIILTLFVFAARRRRENRRLSALIRESSVQDKYSGLYNRDYYLEILAGELERRFRSGNDLSIVFVKVNGLDPDIDNTGEASAEQVMMELSKIVESTSRDIDMTARWSQNELVLLCRDTRAAGAGVLAEKIRENLNRYKFPDLGNIIIDIGIAGAIDEKNPADLINRAQADLRKKSIKKSSRSTVAA